MKVLLIKPPGVYTNLGFKNGPAIDIPLGLLSLAAVLEVEGIDVNVFDANVEGAPGAPVTKKDGSYHFGASFDELAEVIAHESPQVVGISNSFSTHLKTAFQTARVAKQVDPEIVVVVGGPHGTVSPQTFFEESEDFDYVVRGEGEYAFLRLLEQLDSGKPADHPNIYSRADSAAGKADCGALEYIEDLDALPLPAYHLVDLEKYFELDAIGYPSRVKFEHRGAHRSVSIATSRGCPYGCVFCSVKLHMGRGFRPHSVAYVEKHIRKLVDTYGVTHLHFEDDAINLNKRRFDGLLECLQGFEPRVTWDTPNGLRAEGLDEPALKKCLDSGCIYLIIGIESCVPRVLSQVIRKKLNLEVAERALAAAHQVGLDMGAFFLIGFPEETLPEIKETCEKALSYKRDYDTSLHMHFVVPLPGTEIYVESLKKGQFEGYSDYQEMNDAGFFNPLLSSPNYTASQLAEVQQNFERRYMWMILKDQCRFSLRHPLVSSRVFLHELKSFSRRHRPFSSLPRNLYLRHFLHRNALLRTSGRQ